MIFILLSNRSTNFNNLQEALYMFVIDLILIITYLDLCLPLAKMQKLNRKVSSMDSNLQSTDPKSGALSVRPHTHYNFIVTS